MPPVIAALDDEADILELLKVNLQKAGYRFEGFQEADDLFRFLEREAPSLILLDLMLPDTDGLEVCRRIRRSDRLAVVPIIMLTARGDEADKVVGLELGADDYVTKPFNPRELLARIRAVLRRTGGQEEHGPSEVRFGRIVADFVRHEVRASDQVVNLTPTEFRLLEAMIKQPGRAFSRLELLEQAFGYGHEGFERTVDVHIMNLRKKIEPEPGRPRYIVTVPGLGYRFEGADAT